MVVNQMKITTIPKRPTMASARAAKHLADAKECSRMVSLSHAKGDKAAATFWREVWAQKIEDAKQITDDVWRFYK